MDRTAALEGWTDDRTDGAVGGPTAGGGLSVDREQHHQSQGTGRIDWRTFVESLSIVEQTLLRDPTGIHGKMDFGTPDQYRHVIERIAKRSPLTEQAVVHQAVQLATRNKESQHADDRSVHVGYFLIDQGLPELERTTRMRPSLSTRFGKVGRRIPLTMYLGAILIIALGVTVGALGYVATSGWLAWVMGGLLFLGATHLSVGLVNWLVTLSVAPHRLPRLDFSRGIPTEFITLVAVPTILINERSIGHLREGLEVRYLANRDDHLRFCLLTDFRDASQEHDPEDESLRRLAQAGIESLNAKYSHGNGDVFFLFHRPRRWNPREQAWMGHERKRGKLSDRIVYSEGGCERVVLVDRGRHLITYPAQKRHHAGHRYAAASRCRSATRRNPRPSAQSCPC